MILFVVYRQGYNRRAWSLKSPRYQFDIIRSEIQQRHAIWKIDTQQYIGHEPNQSVTNIAVALIVKGLLLRLVIKELNTAKILLVN